MKESGERSQERGGVDGAGGEDDSLHRPIESEGTGRDEDERRTVLETAIKEKPAWVHTLISRQTKKEEGKKGEEKKVEKKKGKKGVGGEGGRKR